MRRLCTKHFHLDQSGYLVQRLKLNASPSLSYHRPVRFPLLDISNYTQAPVKLVSCMERTITVQISARLMMQEKIISKVKVTRIDCHSLPFHISFFQSVVPHIKSASYSNVNCIQPINSCPIITMLINAE